MKPPDAATVLTVEGTQQPFRPVAARKGRHPGCYSRRRSIIQARVGKIVATAADIRKEFNLGPRRRHQKHIQISIPGMDKAQVNYIDIGQGEVIGNGKAGGHGPHILQCQR